MLVGGRLVQAGKMQAPLLLSFVGFCFSLNFAMQGVNFTIADAKRGQSALERVFKVCVGALVLAVLDLVFVLDYHDHGSGGGSTIVDIKAHPAVGT